MQAFIALFLTNLLGPEQLQIMYKYYRKKAQKHKFLGFSLKAPTRFELVIEVLQTFALPLGYGAALLRSDSDGNRTRVTAVKGRCLNRLTTEPYNFTRSKRDRDLYYHTLGYFATLFFTFININL